MRLRVEREFYVAFFVLFFFFFFFFFCFFCVLASLNDFNGGFQCKSSLFLYCSSAVAIKCSETDEQKSVGVMGFSLWATWVFP